MSETSTRIDATKKNLRNSQDLGVKRAVRRWDVATDRVDRHSMKCVNCNHMRRSHLLAVTMGALTEPALEAYESCPKAVKLYAAERGAMMEYLGLGGELPTLRMG